MWYKKGTSRNDMKIYLLSSRESTGFLSFPNDRGIEIFTEDIGSNTNLMVFVQRKYTCSLGSYFGLPSGWNHITVIYRPKNHLISIDREFLRMYFYKVYR